MSATILVYKWPETLHVYNKPLIFNLWHPYCNQKIDTQMLIYTLKGIKKIEKKWVINMINGWCHKKRTIKREMPDEYWKLINVQISKSKLYYNRMCSHPNLDCSFIPSSHKWKKCHRKNYVLHTHKYISDSQGRFFFEHTAHTPLTPTYKLLIDSINNYNTMQSWIINQDQNNKNTSRNFFPFGNGLLSVPSAFWATYLFSPSETCPSVIYLCVPWTIR